MRTLTRFPPMHSQSSYPHTLTDPSPRVQTSLLMQQNEETGWREAKEEEVMSRAGGVGISPPWVFLIICKDQQR